MQPKASDILTAADLDLLYDALVNVQGDCHRARNSDAIPCHIREVIDAPLLARSAHAATLLDWVERRKESLGTTPSYNGRLCETSMSQCEYLIGGICKCEEMMGAGCLRRMKRRKGTQ